ncbi:hypothetical protein Pfo_018854 [Paulownia fortunei]|nr:hypothetical protein Pfo_018854 [Paulownia fortunei]
MAPPILEFRTKRNRTPAKFYGFHTFGEPKDYDVDGRPVWCTFLVYENRVIVLPLCTVEENVIMMKIAMEDLSKKHMMDLRLLNAAAYCLSWFGRWECLFSLGSFGVKEHKYERAIDILSLMELDQVIDEFSLSNGSTHIKQMIHHYRDLSETNLVTIRGLFRFILALKSRYPTGRSSATSAKFDHGRALRNSLFAKEKSLNRWPVKGLKHAAEVIVEALKAKRAAHNVCSCGMTRQEVHDAVRLHIGDTGLIDHVMELMNNVIVGKYVVQHAVSELAVQVILYSKHFVKDWPFRDGNDDSLRLICRLTMNSIDSNAYSTDEEVQDEEILLGINESGRELLVRSCELDLESELRYEGEAENRTVTCKCTAQDVDGEQMEWCRVIYVKRGSICSAMVLKILKQCIDCLCAMCVAVPGTSANAVRF